MKMRKVANEKDTMKLLILFFLFDNGRKGFFTDLTTDDSLISMINQQCDQVNT